MSAELAALNQAHSSNMNQHDHLDSCRPTFSDKEDRDRFGTFEESVSISHSKSIHPMKPSISNSKHQNSKLRDDVSVSSVRYRSFDQIKHSQSFQFNPLTNTMPNPSRLPRPRRIPSSPSLSNPHRIHEQSSGDQFPSSHHQMHTNAASLAFPVNHFDHLMPHRDDPGTRMSEPVGL